MSEETVQQGFWGLLVAFVLLVLFSMAGSNCNRVGKQEYNLRMACINQGGSWIRTDAGFLCLKTEVLKK